MACSISSPYICVVALTGNSIYYQTFYWEFVTQSNYCFLKINISNPNNKVHFIFSKHYNAHYAA
ncbi:hypothetical protein GCM10011402_37270 [Paracoccus acridae]|uniref:Uncharacterized protein n=1 Tax=Paracoccus acridae TaxID=1795310 RepID=A0ABQ1VMU6_9RHOB|nr:hypothetical protein GCM10011402_37270 [Paracoccus acridae]